MSRKFLRSQQQRGKLSSSVKQIFALGLGHHQQGQLKQAEQCYWEVLKQVPEHADSLFNMGVIFQNTGRVNQAIGAYQKLAQAHPNYADAYINLGLILERQGRLIEALGVYQKAVQVKPHYISYYNLAGPLYQLRQYKEAEKNLRESIRINPDFAQSHMNLATVLRDLKRYDEAEEECKTALQLAPNLADAYFNMGKIKESKECFDKAIEYYREALKINPEHEKAQACLHYRLMRACAWDDIAKLEPEIDKLTDKLIAAKRCPGITNFMQIARCDDLQRDLQIAKAWSDYKEKNAAKDKADFSFADRKQNKEKITIGYLSADFRKHTFAYIVKYLFENHNRNRFRIIGYSTSPDDKSEEREYFRENADKFVEVYNLSDKEAAQRIYEDDVDILCDCTCYTAGSRVEIAALRPAPIQVNMWGFVGTTGANFIDYIIADDLVVPDEHQEFYTEKRILFSDTLQINHRNEKISEKEFKRSDFGLPEDGFVFCSLNQSYKIEPVIFATWMKLLKQVERSVLWLRWQEPVAIENLKKAAQESGIAAARLVFAEKLESRPEYFRRLQLADLALDTRIYNGGSTTMDALWAGVPVVTLLGKHYASRMSAGLINGANMPALITKTLEEYESLALKLARNPDELKKLRQKLWIERERCALFDIRNYVRKLEEAYERIWANFLAEREPEDLRVD